MKVTYETPSSNYSKVGVILKAVAVLLENVVLATTMLFGLFNTILNMKYLLKLRYTLEVGIMELHAAEPSRKTQS